MRRSLNAKFILSYLAVALITVLVVSVIIRLTSGKSLMNLVAEQQISLLEETVQSYYTEHGSLDGFNSYYMQINGPQPGQDQPGGAKPPPNKREMRGFQGLVDPSYHALMPTFGVAVGQVVPSDKIKNATSVEVNGQVIAFIVPDTSLQFQLNPEEQLFLKRTTLAIGLAALAGVILAVVMGTFFARKLLNPIRQLTKASKALARGELQQQVPVTTQDELGQLVATFNQMSTDLDHADQQRKRLTADITHDLSTPIQIIAGYIEMLEAGEVALTPQRLEIIKTEIEHLRRLVGDLGTLTQLEAGGLEMHLEPVSPAVLLEKVYHAYQPIAARQGVALKLLTPQSTPAILVDEGRMLQVLKNLVDNALRYTPAGGWVELSTEATEKIELRVKDNGSGIALEDIPFVFDRFYRADKARSGNSGKMGLGLAICKALVTALGGTISVELSDNNQGTSFVIRFDPPEA